MCHPLPPIDLEGVVFDYSPSLKLYDEKKEQDFNPLFPHGVKVKNYDFDGRGMFLVADATMDKLLTKIRTNNLVLLNLNSHKMQKLAFLSMHYLSARDNEESDRFTSYNAMLDSTLQKGTLWMYGAFAYIMPLLTVLTVCLATIGIQAIHKSDNRILLSSGFSRKELWKIDYLPLLWDYLLSIPIAFLFFFFIVHQSSFTNIPSFSPLFTVLWFLLTFLLLTAVSVFSRRKRGQL